MPSVRDSGQAHWTGLVFTSHGVGRAAYWAGGSGWPLPSVGSGRGCPWSTCALLRWRLLVSTWCHSLAGRVEPDAQSKRRAARPLVVRPGLVSVQHIQRSKRPKAGQDSRERTSWDGRMAWHSGKGPMATCAGRPPCGLLVSPQSLSAVDTGLKPGRAPSR